MTAPPQTVALLDDHGIMARPLYADCYILNLLLDGEAVAYRAPLERERPGMSLRLEMTDGEWEALRDFWLSFSQKHMLCRVGGRLAIAVTSLAGAASLGMLLFPHMEEKRFLSLSREDPSRFCYAAGVSPHGCRISAKTQALRPEYESILWELEACFGSMEPLRALPQSGAFETLRRRLYGLSAFCGVPISLRRTDHFAVDDTFDERLFLAFVLLMLLLARRTALLRSAEVKLDAGKDGCWVTVSFRPAEAPSVPPTELMTLEILASRKNIPLEWMAHEDRISVRFMPISPDWSYLGLKQEIDPK